MKNGKHRKELWLTTEEWKIINFVSTYWGSDMTTTMRLLIRLSAYEVITKQLKDGFPRLTAKQVNLLADLENALS